MFSDVEKAYHEAGHATMCLVLGVGIESVTIIPDHELAGYVVPGTEIAESNLAFVCMVKLAGAVAATARRLRTRDEDRTLIGSDGDIESVQYLVGLLVEQSQRESFLVDTIRLAIQLVNQYWASVELIAKVLLLKKTLSGLEAQALFQFAQASSEEKERLCQATGDQAANG